MNASHDGCAKAHAFLSCTVDLHGQSGDEWPVGAWQVIDKIHERETFKALTWLTERIRQVGDTYTEWQSVETPSGFTSCNRCAPINPDLIWLHIKGKTVALEDPIQAGAYERALKARPSPFVTRLLKDEGGRGNIQIGLNIPTLLHRAMSRLTQGNSAEPVTFSWRLETGYTPAAKIPRAKFILSSNKKDEPHTQPPKFKIKLRIEQLRSLTWMLRQEAVDTSPFIEQEISEAILEPLQWRAEGRVEQAIHVRGGVLADAVGYGKTAITLALVDCTSKAIVKEANSSSPSPGKIKTKATLVVVPSQLMKQWDSEVAKFMGKSYETLVISNVSALNKVTIEQIQDADIIIVPSILFKSDAYLSNLEAFAAGPGLPSTAGRYFRSRVEEVKISLAKQVDRLQSEDGPTAVKKEIRDARKRSKST